VALLKKNHRECAASTKGSTISAGEEGEDTSTAGEVGRQPLQRKTMTASNAHPYAPIDILIKKSAKRIQQTEPVSLGPKVITGQNG